VRPVGPTVRRQIRVQEGQPVFAQDRGEDRPDVPQESLSGLAVGERRKLQEVLD
jgi:hypothetical protein